MTPRQKAVYDFVVTRIAATGVSPSFGEISRHVGVKSRENVYRSVQRLIEDGHLVKTPRRARSLRLPEHPPAKLYAGIYVRQDVIDAAIRLVDSLKYENVEADNVIVSAEAFGELDVLVSELRPQAVGKVAA